MKIKKFDFLGVGFSALNQSTAKNLIESYKFDQPAYICFPDSFVVSLAKKDKKLQEIINNALLTMPDGTPSKIFARIQGHKEVSTVSGYHLCKQLLNTGLSHYFYGASPDILREMQKNIHAEFPNARIKGFKAAPFVNTTEEIETHKTILEDINEIDTLKPDLVWIGLSSPKQDFIMKHFHTRLSNSIMLGIGGVFLYMAKEEMKSPEWMKKTGLRWAYRLWKEPGRLGKKYLSTAIFLISNSTTFIQPILTPKKMQKKEI